MFFSVFVDSVTSLCCPSVVLSAEDVYVWLQSVYRETVPTISLHCGQPVYGSRLPTYLLFSVIAQECCCFYPRMAGSVCTDNRINPPYGAAWPCGKRRLTGEHVRFLWPFSLKVAICGHFFQGYDLWTSMHGCILNGKKKYTRNNGFVCLFFLCVCVCVCAV